MDTHISTVFLAGGRAFKVKRSIRLPFLDFTTLEARRRACEREIDVNRRLAPGLYLGLVAVTRSPDGRLGFDGAGEVVEWMIVMTRFDQDGRFDRMADRGLLSRRHIQSLADALAGFHRDAPPRPGWGGEAGLRLTIDTNAATLTRFASGLFSAHEIDALTALSHDWLASLAPLLERRRQEGFVRLCHGDLHLANICLLNGRPTPFDGIEFNDDFACIDTFYDLSFLIMDMDARGLGKLSSLLFNRYLERTGDYAAAAAMPLFLSLRAGIRAHVAAATFHAGGEHGGGGQFHHDEARRYLGRARAYLHPAGPRLIAVGGLSGSGKSRLAASLAPSLGRAPGAVVLRSDVLRKQLSGVATEQRLSPDAYGAEMTARTYDRLLSTAHDLLSAGHAVVLDAVFLRLSQRDAVEALARDCSVPFAGLWLEASPRLLRQRVEGRRGDASDATGAVVDLQLAQDPGPITWHRIDAGAGKGAVDRQARRLLPP
ncbi:MAG: AAA family ATPase [Telmatospirillum sp.]|nr:AAA family ATPase [Telmatospirillum sp.]